MNEQERLYIINLIERYAEEHGNPVLLSDIGTLLKNDSYAAPIRQRYSTLSALVDDLAPEFRQILDPRGVNWVESTLRPTSEITIAPDGKPGYPYVIGAEDVLIEQEILQMHEFAFMGWWNSIYKRLKQLTGYAGNESAMWTRIIARELSLARESDGLMECTCDQQRLCLFRTRLTTEAGETIIAVLQANLTVSTAPWYLKEYTYAGDEDSEYGMWLLTNISPSFHGQSASSAKRLCWKMLERLQSANEAVQEELTRLAGGYLLSVDRIEAVRKYLSTMTTVVHNLNPALLSTAAPMDSTITALTESVRPAGLLSSLTPLEKSLQDLVRRIDLVLVNFLMHDTQREDHTLAIIRSFIETAGSGIRNGNDASAYLDDYQKWSSLLCHTARALWLKDATHHEEITGNFRIPGPMLNLFANSPIQDADEVQQITTTIEQTESHLSDFVAAVQASAAESAEVEDPVEEDLQMPDLFDEDADVLPPHVEFIDLNTSIPLFPAMSGEDAPALADDDLPPSDELLAVLKRRSAASVPAENAAPAKKDDAPAERVTLSEHIDPAIMQQIAEGKLDPEEECMYLGAWTPGLSGDPVAPETNPQDLARLMLTEPSARTVENLVFCIQDALSRNSPAHARALLSTLQPGWQRLLYDYLLEVRSLTDNQYPIARMTILTDNLPTKLSTLLQKVKGESLAIRREVILAVLAHIPLIMTSCLYPVGVSNLLAGLLDYQPLMNDLGLARVSKELRNFVVSCNGAHQHSDLSAGLRKAYAAKRNANAITQLQSRTRTLETRFTNCAISYRNAREVVKRFCLPDLPRTYAMFQCLYKGQADLNVEPFEGDNEMRAFINQSQQVFIEGNPGDIGGPAMSAALHMLRDLNNAYIELREISGSIGLPAELSDWFRNGVDRLGEWNNALMQAIHNHLPASPLKNYLILLCSDISPDLPEPLVSSFDYQRSNDSVWPFWDEDRLITALFDLSGCDSEINTRELSRRMFFSDDSDAERKEQHKTLDQLISVCDDLIGQCNLRLSQLNSLFIFNTIDQGEYKQLIESLSKAYGWLTQTHEILSANPAAMSSCAPVVRHEICLWYVNKRIDAIYRTLAQSAKALLVPEGGETDGSSEQLLRQIDDAVEQRNIQFIADRFLDELTDATRLSPRACHADRFFELRTQTALASLCSDKTEDWCRGDYEYRLDPSLQLDRVVASAEQFRSLGLALRYMRRYVDEAGSMPASELKELENMFVFLGFSKPELKQEAGAITLSVVPPDRSICPLPALGIGAADRKSDGEWRITYRVRIMKDAASVFALLNADNRATSGGACTILLCPFPITFAERQEMKRLTHNRTASCNFFLLDKSFLRYAVCRPDSERLPAFYACASHLIRLNPYSTETNPQRWQDAFFGREVEIQRLMNMNDCSVIYGGRRLGKTSIMRELEFRWNFQSKQHMAIYINLQHTSPLEMWYRIAEALQPYIPEMKAFRAEAPTSEQVEDDARSIRKALTDFLLYNDAKLMLLLDECDTLVYTDALLDANDSGRTSRLHELITLRNACSKNFKFILAGLQGVTRFVQHLDAFTLVRTTNHPVYQCLSDAVRVRPLVETDSASAYDLVDAPFRMMGYRLEHESILHILRICCFRPNLIQNYCRCLLDALHSKRDVAFLEDSLYMHVPHQLVQSVENSSSYKDNHRKQGITIPLNAGSTAVYEPIAYAVALLSLRNSTRGRFTGFSATEVLELINSYNPAFTNNRSIAHDYIRTILSELAFMGVLREIEAEQRYALFSSYILRLLGDSQTIEETLRASIDGHIRNRDNAPDRTELFSLRRVIDDFVLPLTNAQLVTLNTALTEHGFAVITGSPMLSLNDIPQMLRYIRFSKEPGCLHELDAADLADPGRLEALLSDIAEDTDHNLLLHGDWPENLFDTIQEIRASHPHIRFILLITPRTCTAQLEALAALPPETVMHPTRLSPASRMILFEAITADRFQNADEMEMIRRVSEATGDWPSLFLLLMEQIRSRPQDDFDTILQDFTGSLSMDEIRTSMGLDQVNPNIWKSLVDFPNLAEAIYMGSDLHGLSTEDFLTALAYLQHMDLADVTGEATPDSIRAELQDMERKDSGEETPHHEPCIVKLDAFACRVMAERGADA